MTRILASLIGALMYAALAAAAPGAVSAAAAADQPAGGAMLGFSGAHALDEQATERRFDDDLDAAQLRDWMRTMSSEPNQVGSAHDKANAEFMLQKFREWGWDASIETFSVLYPTPKRIALQLLGPKRYSAKLSEPAIKGDASSGNTAAALPPYNVYGADGDVSGELVYVNYGMPDDYKELDRRAISVKGKIVLARYRGGWRGLKPKLAHEHGAIGCLIYSDPRDDGYYQGDPYPAGGWRPADGVQRGSVADIPIYSGDPLTPGIGATADAPRLVEVIANPLPTTVLILVGGGGTVPAPIVKAVTAHGQVLDVATSRAGDRKAWLHEHLRGGPVKLDPAAADLLAQHLGEDLGRVEGLLSALSAAYGEGARISADDLAPYLGEAGAVPRYELTDAIDRGQPGTALAVLHRMLDAGGLVPIQVLATLHGHFANMLALDGEDVMGERDAAAVLGTAPFVAKKALEQSRRLGSAQIGHAIALIARADLDVRGASGLSPVLVVEILVARLARQTRPTRPARPRAGSRS